MLAQMAYFSLSRSINGCVTGPNTHPSYNAKFICPGQIVGATFLLIGSLIYTYWAYRAAAVPPVPHTVPGGKGGSYKELAPSSSSDLLSKRDVI